MRKWLLFALIVGGVLVLDQVSKGWVLANLALGETYPIIPALHPYFQITYSANTGAAFGIFPQAGDLFSAVSAMIAVVIMVVYARLSGRIQLLHVGLSLIVGGGVGNLIDRLQHGHVVDFFHVRIPGVISNVSNFADHAIVIGVALVLIDNLLQERAQKRQQALTQDADETRSDSAESV